MQRPPPPSAIHAATVVASREISSSVFMTTAIRHTSLHGPTPARLGKASAVLKPAASGWFVWRNRDAPAAAHLPAEAPTVTVQSRAIATCCQRHRATVLPSGSAFHKGGLDAPLSRS